MEDFFSPTFTNILQLVTFVIAIVGAAYTIVVFIRKRENWRTAALVAGLVSVVLLVALVVTHLLTPPTHAIVPPQGWTQTLNDPLQHNNLGNDWDTGPDDPGTTRTFSDGGYHLTTPANDGIEGVANNTDDTFTDFYFQATMIIKSGTTDSGGGAGLVFRADAAGSDYLYSFDSQGNWTLEVYNTSTQQATQLPTQGVNQDAVFHKGAGQANILGVKASGQTITLYVNGVELSSAVDGALGSGLIGFEVDTGTSKAADVLFKNAGVWVPA